MAWFGFRKNNTKRRREIRRDICRPAPSWLGWLRCSQLWWAVLYACGFAFIGALIALYGRSQPQYQVGQIVTEPIIARVSFNAVDRDKTQLLKQNAYNKEPAVYTLNDNYFHKLKGELSALGHLATNENITSLDAIPQQTRTTLFLTPKSFKALRQYVSDPDQTPWDQLSAQILQWLASIAVLSDRQAQLERGRSQLASKIVIRHPDRGDEQRHDEDIIGVNGDIKILRTRVELLLQGKLPAVLRRMVTDIVTRPHQPFYLLDAEATERRRQSAFDDPTLFEEVDIQPNEVLVPAGGELTAFDAQLIRLEHRAYMQALGPALTGVAHAAGLCVFLLIGSALWAYFLTYKPKIIDNPMRGLAVAGLLLSCQALAVTATVLQPQFVYVTAVLPTLLAAIVLVIAYDQRFALAVGAIHSLIVLLSLDQGLGFNLVLLGGIGTAVGQLRDVRNRSKLVIVGLWTGVVMAVTTLVVGLAMRHLHLEGEIKRVLFDSLIVCAAGFAAGMFVQGVLPGIEKLFGVTTAMTLKELSDASHPLLRRLVQDAPGTYQHSLRIADMAEPAAEAVGVDALLCKVGAMYHDIGKINKPIYFVENQAGGPNRHNKLSPAMSLLVIIGHVKDGIELAREYSLPSVIKHFIESHHGTTLVEYFYQAAKQQSDAENKPAPTEFEFRYPGPKPQTKEAAILMLCDGIEGAARAMDDPNANRIEQLVHAMANKRLMDGQFDECNLTLRELHKIERSIIKTLCAIYHGRIKYPDAQSSTDKPQERNPTLNPSPSASAVS